MEMSSNSLKEEISEKPLGNVDIKEDINNLLEINFKEEVSFWLKIWKNFFIYESRFCSNYYKEGKLKMILKIVLVCLIHKLSEFSEFSGNKSATNATTLSL